MHIKQIMAMILALILLAAPVLAEGLEPLPMDTYAFGAAPKDENYISDYEYVDSSISVKIYDGRYADTDYLYAHIKISHPSQLRTAAATMVDSAKGTFKYATEDSTVQGRYIARAVNAVFAINGDYFTKTDKCQVVLRQSIQVRNTAWGDSELLIIDKNGDFSYLKEVDRADYVAYYEENHENMYQVMCFGPVLVENGASVIPPDYQNGSIGAQNLAQRSAICQLGPLEYMVVTSYGPQSENNKGMTIPEFATVCEMAGKELAENGCILAYNLDGGNSATMLFKQRYEGKLYYVKVNCPEIERFLSDIIYFATLEK